MKKIWITTILLFLCTANSIAQEEVIVYYDNGKLHSIGKMISGKRNVGERKYYYADGNFQCESYVLKEWDIVGDARKFVKNLTCN